VRCDLHEKEYKILREFGAKRGKNVSFLRQRNMQNVLCFLLSFLFALCLSLFIML
jgi:hypothetical protein